MIIALLLVKPAKKITLANELRPGDEVNIEIDVVARYLERLMSKTGT